MQRLELEKHKLKARETIKKKLEDTSTLLDEAQASNESYARENRRLKTENAVIDDLEKTVKQQHKQLDTLETEKADFIQEQAQIKAQLNKATTDNQRLKEECGSLEEANANLQGECSAVSLKAKPKHGSFHHADASRNQVISDQSFYGVGTVLWKTLFHVGSRYANPAFKQMIHDDAKQLTHTIQDGVGQ